MENNIAAYDKLFKEVADYPQIPFFTINGSFAFDGFSDKEFYEIILGICAKHTAEILLELQVRRNHLFIHSQTTDNGN